jgi:AcrR family transcriptional regulator
LTLPETDYLEFPGKDAILASLLEVVPEVPRRRRLLEDVAERLDSRTYDSAAFVFILMEIFYNHADGEELGKVEDLLSVCVVALSQDPQLGRSAAEAYREIQESYAV